MPVIPGADQSQVLNAGSPVPIASAESQRAFGEAQQQLGAQMFRLGDALDTAAKQAKNRQAKLDLGTANSLYLVKDAERRFETDRAGLGKDPYDNVKVFTTNSTDDANQIAEQLADPQVKQEFLADATKRRAESTLLVQAQQIKKFDDQGSAKVQYMVNNLATNAYMEPNRAGQRMQDVDAFLLDNHDIPEFQKIDVSLKAKKQIAISSMDGFTNADTPDYAAAKHALNVLYSPYFTPEERDSQNKRLDALQWERRTHSWQSDDRVQKLAKEQTERDQDNALNDVMNQVQQAGSAREVETILRNGATVESLGTKNYSFAHSVGKERTVDEDGSRTLGVFDQIDAGKLSISGAKDRVLELAQDGFMSKPKAEQLWKFFKDAEERQKRDPLFMRKVGLDLAAIKAQGVPEDMQEKMMRGILGPGPEVQQSIHAQGMYLQDVMNGMDTNQAKNKAILHDFGSSPKNFFIPGVKYSPDDSDEQIKHAVDKANEGASKGTQLERLRALDKLMSARQRQKALDQDQRNFQNLQNSKKGAQ